MKKFTSAVLALSFVALSACADSYDREETIESLVEEQAIDRPAAECIVDGMEREIGVDRLNDSGDPTEAEIAAIQDITLECLLGG